MELGVNIPKDCLKCDAEVASCQTKLCGVTIAVKEEPSKPDHLQTETFNTMNRTTQTISMLSSAFKDKEIIRYKRQGL